jgi:CDP-4-dehydro-6-deoxyglucose reductase
MKVGDVDPLRRPAGRFRAARIERPIVFVAGATGFAPVKSMVEDAFHRGLKRPIYLYWGVRAWPTSTCRTCPQRWAREHENFHFIPVLSDAAPEDNWSGRTGLVHEAILADFPDLAGKEIYACGSVKMVEAIFPSLKSQGAEEGMCFSDAFTVSARSMAMASSRCAQVQALALSDSVHSAPQRSSSSVLLSGFRGPRSRPLTSFTTPPS